MVGACRGAGEAPKTAILRFSLMFTLTTRGCPLTFLPTSPQNRLSSGGNVPASRARTRVILPTLYVLVPVTICAGSIPSIPWVHISFKTVGEHKQRTPTPILKKAGWIAVLQHRDSPRHGSCKATVSRCAAVSGAKRCIPTQCTRGRR